MQASLSLSGPRVAPVRWLARVVRSAFAVRPARPTCALEARCLDLTIPAGDAVCIVGGALVTVRCTKGAVWITEDGSHVDITLQAGELAELRRPGKTVIVAVRRSTLTVASPLAPTTAHRS